MRGKKRNEPGREMSQNEKGRIGKWEGRREEHTGREMRKEGKRKKGRKLGRKKVS